jgi:cation transport regulator ChaC
VKFPQWARSRRPRRRRTLQSCGTVRGGALLYFAYDANIEPSRLAEVAPEAEFRFIAHLPEWRLTFPIPNGDGGLPSVHPEAGNAVWGAVFSIGSRELAAVNDREADEGRTPRTAHAMDREGRRHEVVVHVSESENGEYMPEPSYLGLMVAGGRHWNLPAGWVANLEEYLDGH